MYFILEKTYLGVHIQMLYLQIVCVTIPNRCNSTTDNWHYNKYSFIRKENKFLDCCRLEMGITA